MEDQLQDSLAPMSSSEAVQPVDDLTSSAPGILGVSQQGSDSDDITSSDEEDDLDLNQDDMRLRVLMSVTNGIAHQRFLAAQRVDSNLAWNLDLSSLGADEAEFMRSHASYVEWQWRNAQRAHTLLADDNGFEGPFNDGMTDDLAEGESLFDAARALIPHLSIPEVVQATATKALGMMDVMSSGERSLGEHEQDWL